MDERLSPRTHLDRPITCQFGATVITVHLYDLSIDGCMIEAPPALCDGDELSIQLLPHFNVTGRVVWSDKGQAGVLFDEKIHPVVVHHLGFHVSAAAKNSGDELINRAKTNAD